MGKLTRAMVNQLTKPGRYGDGGTLYLHIAPGGSKSWVQRIMVQGVRRDIGLGPVDLVPLSKAREIATLNRGAVFEGRDPTAPRREVRKAARKAARKAKRMTFRAAAQRTHDAKLATWRSQKSGRGWMQRLERYAMPLLGDVRVSRIERADVLAVLVPIWTSKPETARKTRAAIHATLQWSIAYGHIRGGVNVAGEVINGALPTLPAVTRNMPALPHGQVAAALAAVEDSTAHISTRLAFRFLVLTAVRSGEARGATWAEIALQGATWTIPGTRTKTGREHRVPLSGAAMDVLSAAEAHAGQHSLVFPTARGKVMSDSALSRACRENEVGAVPHGFRSSFRTWAGERTNADHAVMELSLGHAVGSAVEQAYARGDLLAKRRRLMDFWAAYVTGESANKVVKLRA